MQPSFADGSADLTVSGLNVLHQLRRKQYTTTWTDKKDSEIAQDLAQRTDNGQQAVPAADRDRRRGAAARRSRSRWSPSTTSTTSTSSSSGPASAATWCSSRRRTRRRAGSGSSTSAPRKPGMIPGLRDVSFELAWGRSLMEFKPTIKTANQICSVTVRGWHRTRKEPISRTVTLDDERITANKDLHRVINACAAREEMVVDEPVFTNCEARERAIAILLDQTKEMVTADVKVVGLPDLRAGQIVVIKELGARLQRQVLRHQDPAHHRRHRLPHHLQLPARGRRRTDGDQDVRRGRRARHRRRRPGRAGPGQAELPWLADGRDRQRLGADRAPDGRQGSRLLLHARGRRRGARRLRARRLRPPDVLGFLHNGVDLPPTTASTSTCAGSSRSPATCSTSTTATARRASGCTTKAGHQLELQRPRGPTSRSSPRRPEDPAAGRPGQIKLSTSGGTTVTIDDTPSQIELKTVAGRHGHDLRHRRRHRLGAGGRGEASSADRAVSATATATVDVRR